MSRGSANHDTFAAERAPGGAHPPIGRAVASRRFGLLRVFAAVAAALLAVASPATGTQEATLRPGKVVITQFREGLVLAIDSQGVTRQLISGLVTPRGIAVLLDQTVLVAENTANQITVFGGVFGTSKLKLADFPAPEGLAVAPDGQTAYVTSYREGILGVVDLANRKVDTVATGFVQPTGVYVRGSDIYVAEVGEGDDTGRIIKVSRDGRKSVFAQGLGGPFGLAGTPDGFLYVTDYKNDRIMKIDAEGKVSEFVKATKPVGLGVSPVQPRANEPYVIVANTENSVRYWDASGNEVGTPVFYSASSAVGLSVVPGGSATVPTTAGGGVAGTSTTRSPGVTRPAGSTTLLQNPAGEDDESSIVGPLLAGVAFVVLVGVGVAAAAMLARRNRTTAEAGFADLESQFTMTQAMGPCAALEVELAGAESALASVLEQIEAAKARQEEANGKVEAAKKREAELAKRGDEAAPAGTERESADQSAPPTGGFTLEQLKLKTEEGRAALRLFGRKEITAAELRERWEALGETEAIRVVTGMGAQANAAAKEAAGGDGTTDATKEAQETTQPSPLEEARAARERAERERTEATMDLGRLAEREKQARERLDEVRKKLAECHEQQRAAEQEAAAAAAAAFAQQSEAERDERDLSATSDEATKDTDAAGPAEADKPAKADEPATSDESVKSEESTVADKPAEADKPAKSDESSEADKPPKTDQPPKTDGPNFL